MQGGDDVHDLLTGGCVEVARRFVGEQHARLVHQSSRDGDALTFAARKLAGSVVQAVAHAEGVEQATSAIVQILASAAVAERAVGDERTRQRVAQHIELREQVVELEDKAEGGVACPGGGAVGNAAEVRVVEVDRSRIGPVEQAQQVQERRLALAASTFDGHKFAGLDGKIEPVEHADGLLAHAKLLREIGGLEEHRAAESEEREGTKRRRTAKAEK